MEALTKQAAAQSKKDWANTQDAIKDSTKAVGQGIEDAGAKAKAAAKQSIDCIASLFTHC